MTDQGDKTTQEDAAVVAGPVAQPAANGFSRRDLLRGAAIAAPSTVTMNTASAAIAMSSVSTYTGVTTPNQTDGNYYCLADQGTLGPRNGNTNTLQVGSTSMPNVQRIAPRDYQTVKSGDRKDAISEIDMCRNADKINGTTYHYNDGGWKTVKVKGGLTISAAPMTSLGVTPTSVDV